MCKNDLPDERGELLEIASMQKDHSDVFQIIQIVSGTILAAYLILFFMGSGFVGYGILVFVMAALFIYMNRRISQQKRRIDALVKLLELDKSGKENEIQTK